MGHPSRRLQEAFAEHVFEEARQAPSTSHVRIIFFRHSSMINTGTLQSMWLFVVCCFSRSAYWLPTRKKLTHTHTHGLYTSYYVGTTKYFPAPFPPFRALSLRNLVSGYECGRVFPAGVGPGSPSRDAANWLPSRSDLSVETRRQYGWLRMVFSGVRLFRAPIWWPSGGWRHARGREHCRGEPGGSLSGGYAPDSAKAEGSSIVDEPGEG